MRERLAHPVHETGTPEFLFLVLFPLLVSFSGPQRRFAVLDTACISNALFVRGL
nr:MAG TPA: hypothetical protein [Caudoviricetes sp.]